LDALPRCKRPANFNGWLMDLGLRGRKAIICASSQGLGKGCALALAEAGVAVVINGRQRESLEATAEEIRARYITGQNIVMDGGEYPAAF
jgi:3-oxoacyl-[acyl-carrier protein] reductase